MTKALTARNLLISLVLTLGAWGYLYVMLWMANAIWPAGGGIR
jgi:hypothetical protein